MSTSTGYNCSLSYTSAPEAHLTLESRSARTPELRANPTRARHSAGAASPRAGVSAWRRPPSPLGSQKNTAAYLPAHFHDNAPSHVPSRGTRARQASLARTGHIHPPHTAAQPRLRCSPGEPDGNSALRGRGGDLQWCPHNRLPPTCHATSSTIHCGADCATCFHRLAAPFNVQCVGRQRWDGAVWRRSVVW